MKSIRRQILIYTLLPFLVIYSSLSAFIVYQVYRIQMRETAWELRNMALYSEASLLKAFEIMELSAQISARELEMIDPVDPAARDIGEKIITSRFFNPQVLNVWLAFEPNAFDGNDSYHVGEYPGAPSGRFIRSYFRDGDSWIMVEDMDETTLDDMEESFYYVIPKKTGAFFTGLGSHELLWDYGFGPVYVFAVAEPVFRDGKFIGVVGIDSMIDDNTMGNKIYPDAISALFMPDGTLHYYRDSAMVGKNLEELGFNNSAGLSNQLKNRNEPFLYTGFSGLSGVNSFNYFYPLEINGDRIFIYTSMPQRDVWMGISPVLILIGSSFLVCLVVFTLLFLYFSRGIAAPLKKLTEASESIVSGNLDMSISVVNSKDEMGMISKSLVRMAEQFRMGKLLQERYYDRFDIILRIHYALFRSGNKAEAFNSLLSEVSAYFNVFKSTFVLLVKENPMIVALYPSAEREEGDSEFFAHKQVSKLLEGKKHLTVSGGILESYQFTFINFNTKSLCILPLRVSEVLAGYIIMEGKKQEMLVNDDTTLMFLGDVLSYLIKSSFDMEEEFIAKEKQPSAALTVFEHPSVQEFSMIEEENVFFEKARNIQNLDVEKGILLIGGEKKRYTELLRITIKVISEEILKMRNFYSSDLPAFAIEVHGIKSALFNIGAEALGDEAKQLEFAAKSDDTVYCKESYPLFEEKLRVFSRNLAALFPQQERNSRTGDRTELVDALEKAKDACEKFDVAAANSLLAPFINCKWEDDTIQKNLGVILMDMENLEYDGLTEKISRLINLLRDQRQ